jgi:transcriptional regulator with XRE-family HTH domain
MHTLSKIVKDKLDHDTISIREAGRQIGVSATTISRILSGESIDVDTLISVCGWAGVSPSDVLDAELKDDRALGSKIASVLGTVPEVWEVFEKIINELDEGNIDLDTTRDLISYTTWRLDKVHAKRNSKDNGEEY